LDTYWLGEEARYLSAYIDQIQISRFEFYIRIYWFLLEMKRIEKTIILLFSHWTILHSIPPFMTIPCPLRTLLAKWNLYRTVLDLQLIGSFESISEAILNGDNFIWLLIVVVNTTIRLYR